MSNQIVAGAEVREGEILAGKYRIDRVLGVGGMGVVVAAHHIHLDDRVAIKFLLPEALASQEAVSRFSREARAAVRIKGEHVARVSDVGTLENGAPYMVMEYLDGSDLSAWVERRGALPIQQAVEFVLQACEAIAEAHALGIVHRDLKPANLFVIRRPDGSESVKVLDFGISKNLSQGAGSDMTRTSAMMGSPLYMSPEQVQSSKDVDGRTDIWALGVILYELVTGQSPFVADTLAELVYKIMSVAPAPLRNKRPDAPLELESVIFKCLEKDRARRYGSVGELAIALLDFGPSRSRGSVERISGILKAAGISGAEYSVPPPSGRSDARSAQTAASWGRTSPQGSAPLGRGAILGVVAVVLCLVVGGAVAVLRKGSVEPAASAVAAHDGVVPVPSLEPAPSAAPATPPVAATGPVVTAAPVAAATVVATPHAEKPMPTQAKPSKPVLAPRASAPRPVEHAAPPAVAKAPSPAAPEPAPAPAHPSSEWGGRL